MASFSCLGLGLGIVFGCLILALLGEVCYLLWWKKKTPTRGIDQNEEHHSKLYAKELFHFICWRKGPSSKNNNSQVSVTTSLDLEVNGVNGHHEEKDLELGNTKDNSVGLKGFDEESVECELMRLHNLAGPPRFLFTIKEETKEDLESEDGKSRGDRSRKGSRTKSLGDLFLAVDTPFLTPLASPRLKSSPLSYPLDCYNNHGFNPLFESSTEAELNRLASSPPPKFKFLRDAEEKLYRRLKEEAKLRAMECSKVSPSEEKDDGSGTGSMFTIIVGKSKPSTGKEHPHYHHHHSHNGLPQLLSSNSQVLPLASSPTTYPEKKQIDPVECRNRCNFY